MVRAMDTPPAEHEKLGRHFSACFVREFLAPAASALLDLHEAMPCGGVPVILRRFSIGHLVRLGDGRMAPLDATLETWGAGEGSREFRIGDVIVTLDPAEFSNTVKQNHQAPISGACAAMHTLRADLLTLSGCHTDLPEVSDLNMEALFAPHRVVNMNARYDEIAGSAPAGAQALALGAPRIAALVGVALTASSKKAKFERFAAVADALCLAVPKAPSAIWLEAEVDSRASPRSHAWQQDFGGHAPAPISNACFLNSHKSDSRLSRERRKD